MSTPFSMYINVCPYMSNKIFIAPGGKLYS